MSSLVVPGVMMYASKLRLPFSFTSRTCTGLRCHRSGASDSVVPETIYRGPAMTLSHDVHDIQV